MTLEMLELNYHLLSLTFFVFLSTTPVMGRTSRVLVKCITFHARIFSKVGYRDTPNWQF